MTRKNVLITGCGPHGIGGALARQFQLRGHRVFASGLSDALLADFRDLGMDTVVMDVTSGASIAEAVAHVRKAGDGRLDILVNNAGVFHFAPFLHTAPEDARRVFEVNVLGMHAVTQAFAPLLLQASGGGDGGEAGGRGDAVVANLASTSSFLRPPFISMYSASKAALEVLSATLRTELAPLGIRVITVKTGGVRTGFTKNVPPTKLPEGSPYAPIKDVIEGRGMLDSGTAMDVDQYAQNVVDELLRPSVKRVIWQGGLVTILRLLSWFVWDGLLVRTIGSFSSFSLR